jgi:hypothetical protein
MGIENILSHLSGLKPGKGDGRWIAKCPAHEDRSPSLAIRLMDDGRILLHCFAGCAAAEIVTKLNLSWNDLFPEPLTRTYLAKAYAPFSALDALQCLVAESTIVAIAASDITLGKSLNDQDLERVATATGRIATALEVVHGR